MPNFTIHYTMRGPAGTVEVPNSPSPVECESLDEVLAQLAGRLPKVGFGVEVIGVKIQQVDKQEKDQS